MKNQSVFKRMGFALQGINIAFRMESSFRLQCLAALMVIIVLCWSRPPLIWWALLLLNCGMVLAAELFNTALEQLIDPYIRASRLPRTAQQEQCYSSV
jgi:diacylglycerol kinase (ATP)